MLAAISFEWVAICISKAEENHDNSIIEIKEASWNKGLLDFWWALWSSVR
jgi:hypothetical protein